VQIDVEKLVYGGDGLSRHEGRVVLTPYVLPAEQVQVAIARERKDMLEARVEQIVTPSPQRVEPTCPHFGSCGGCHYQHAAYGYQVEQKIAIVREVFARSGRIEIPGEIEAITAEPWGYRNRIQIHIDGTKVGFREGGSHKLQAIEQCPISSPKLNESLATLRSMLRSPRWPGFVRSIELFTNEKEVQLNVIETMAGKRVARQFFDWCENEIKGAITGPLEYDGFRVSHRSFFQVNRFLLKKLVKAAISNYEGELALELYAGVGLFSIPLADRFARVVAVESSKSAVEDLEVNARRAKKSVEHHRASSDLFLETMQRKPQFVLADPPRAGMGAGVIRDLIRLKPQRISIVSCDPSTLARDLKGLLEAGYAIERCQMIDLFPQTFHIETITHLVHGG
jgi:23S rRNA (uracil1939-C5)-methyltransferase